MKPADITERASVEAAARAAGGVDILLNAAGIDVIGLFLESDEADRRRTIGVDTEEVAAGHIPTR